MQLLTGRVRGSLNNAATVAVIISDEDLAASGSDVVNSSTVAKTAMKQTHDTSRRPCVSNNCTSSRCHDVISCRQDVRPPVTLTDSDDMVECGNRAETEDDEEEEVCTTTSGSFNAGDLCDEIDQLFFAQNHGNSSSLKDDI